MGLQLSTSGGGYRDVIQVNSGSSAKLDFERIFDLTFDGGSGDEEACYF